MHIFGQPARATEWADASTLEIEPGLRVRETPAIEIDLPMVGARGRQAVLELDGRWLARGNRSYLVRAAFRIAEFLALPHMGEGERKGIVVTVLQVTMGRGGEPRLVSWLAPRACELLHVEAFEAASTCVMYAGRPLLGSGRFALGDRVDILLDPRPGARVADLAIITRGGLSFA